jgi:hypothetical protein
VRRHLPATSTDGAEAVGDAFAVRSVSSDTTHPKRARREGVTKCRSSTRPERRARMTLAARDEPAQIGIHGGVRRVVGILWLEAVSGLYT